MESTTTTSGCTSLIWSKMASSEFSQSSKKCSWLAVPPPTVSLSALIFSWWALSSPLTYSTFLSVSWSMVCSDSVDLPMPGSPPSSTMLPGTSPPPSTRFNSASCMSMRGSSCDEMSFSRSTLPVANAEDCAEVPLFRPFLVSPSLGEELATLISLNVFHWPQAGHLPIHLADSCPQLSQTYMILSFAILLAKVQN